MNDKIDKEGFWDLEVQIKPKSKFRTIETIDQASIFLICGSINLRNDTSGRVPLHNIYNFRRLQTVERIAAPP